MSGPCLFCEIAAGRAAADRVFEEPGLVAFLDHRPVFLGHVLIVPRRHVAHLLELPPELGGPLFDRAQRVARAFGEVLGAEGSFVALNDRVSQSVPHLHLHVIPRRKGDGLRGFFWPRLRYESDEKRAALAERLAAAYRALAPGGAS